jgi:putative tryptophan/tyrosine transport system substrate-binding protein
MVRLPSGLAMRRREFIGLVGGAAAWPLTARAQAKIYAVGILETVPRAQNQANFAALLNGLRELGYVEGQNLRIDYRSADGRGERFPALAAELVRSRVDLIVTRGTPAARAAKAATTTIPIVMAAIGEPLGVGVVASLAHPGGNVTGLSAFVTELSGKRIELLKEAFPSVSAVGHLNNLGNPVAPPQWEATRAVASQLQLTAELYDVRSEADIVQAFSTMADKRLGALTVGIDFLIQAHAARIIELAARHRIPTAYPTREMVEGGGLLSYGVNYPHLYFRAAGLIDKVFKGTSPADLPVEQPTKLELVINLRTAKALSFEFPPTLLARADEVIE